MKRCKTAAALVGVSIMAIGGPTAVASPDMQSAPKPKLFNYQGKVSTGGAVDFVLRRHKGSVHVLDFEVDGVPSSCGPAYSFPAKFEVDRGQFGGVRRLHIFRDPRTTVLRVRGRLVPEKRATGTMTLDPGFDSVTCTTGKLEWKAKRTGPASQD